MATKNDDVEEIAVTNTTFFFLIKTGKTD